MTSTAKRRAYRVAAIVGVLLLIGFVLTVPFEIRYTGQRAVVAVGAARFVRIWDFGPTVWDLAPEPASHLTVRRIKRLFDGPWKPAFAPTWKTTAPFRYVTFPTWPVAVLVLIGTVIAWRRSRPPPDPNACRRCGYNLTANTSGRCPECGTAIQ